ncbi:MAG: BMP family protein [Nitratireductor sp.]
MKLFKSLITAGALALSASVAFADAEPALIYDLGGKLDKSFNEAAFQGAEKFNKDTGIAYRDFELQSDAQREQSLRRFAQQGRNPVVVAGFSWGGAMGVIAKEFPDTKFVIIDSVVDQPNVRSVVFKEQEGSYLVGLLAAMASKSKKVGFVGGMDIPLIRAFGCGYKQGAVSVGADVEVFQNMTGTTGAAWNDPVKGGELAKSQIGRGADVVYHAAGGTGIGVLQAAADSGALGIGVDKNQNHLHPGKVLTSMLKRVDVAVFEAMNDVNNDKFTAGVQVLGLAEGGVGVALDDNNKALINAEMSAALDAASKKIISGEVVVHDYRSDDKCPL